MTSKAKVLVVSAAFLFLGMVSTGSRAQDKTARTAVPPRGDGRVLDFDADVIEGERQRPDFLFQTGTPGVSLDSLLFGRKDFNDFLKVDKKRRPTYVVPNTKARP